MKEEEEKEKRKNRRRRRRRRRKRRRRGGRRGGGEKKRNQLVASCKESFQQSANQLTSRPCLTCVGRPSATANFGATRS